MSIATVHAPSMCIVNSKSIDCPVVMSMRPGASNETWLQSRRSAGSSAGRVVVVVRGRGGAVDGVVSVAGAGAMVVDRSTVDDVLRWMVHMDAHPQRMIFLEHLAKRRRDPLREEDRHA